jgi:hypothetical protein
VQRIRRRAGNLLKPAWAEAGAAAPCTNLVTSLLAGLVQAALGQEVGRSNENQTKGGGGVELTT